MKDYYGDKGTTNLYGGKIVSKSSVIVDAYGSVDELNCFIGLAMARLETEELTAILTEIQKQLFRLGSDLATPIEKPVERIDATHIEYLESTISTLEQELEPLKNFILPGGAPAAALLHVARAICRRVERRVVALETEQQINKEVHRYLNRLSDTLFVLARTANKRAGVNDVIWKS